MTLVHWFQKLGVFLKVSAHLDLYKPLDLFFRYFLIFLLCLSYMLFSRVIWQDGVQFDGYRIDLPLLIISGVAMTRFIYFPINLFHKTFTDLKLAGMAEWIDSTPVSIWEFMASRALWIFFLAYSEFVCFIIFSNFFIKMPMHLLVNPVFFASILLCFLSYCGLGMMIMGVILFLRRGTVLTVLINRLSFAFCGVFFPISFLPSFIKILANILPLTHALKIIRGAALSVPVASGTYWALILITAVNCGIGFVAVERGLAYERENRLP